MQNQEIFKKPVWEAIFSMGIPSLISVLVMIIYNMADMYFIGFLNDYTQVAAVSLIMPVFSIMTAVSMLLGNGGCTLIAQALGAGEKKRARSYMSLCIWTAILLGVIIAGLIIVFSNPLLKFLGTNEEMWQYARNYMLILAVGSPAMLLNYEIACLVRGEGAIKPGLIANFVSTGMNILLDPVLILGVKMGVSGAALATVLSNVIGIVYLIWYKCHFQHFKWVCINIQQPTPCTVRNKCSCGDGGSRQGNDDSRITPDGALYGCSATDGVLLRCRGYETYQRGRDEVIYSYIRDWRCFRSGGNAWKQSSGWSVYPGFGSC